MFSYCTSSFAQGEFNTWYFGQGAGISFNGGVVTAITDGKINATEGSASVSDAEGNHLFSTNGVYVIDAKGDTMPNGTGLGGHTSSTQSAIIVPKPGKDTNIFYIITADVPSLNGSTSNALAYSTVDMNAANGFGNVIEKNVVLYDTTTEKLTMVRHANGQDVWVLSHKWNSDEYYAHLITSEGFCNTPVVSAIGTYHGLLTNSGSIKASPNGKKVVNAMRNVDPSWEHNIELFDFNNETGELSNTIAFLSTHPRAPYGVEFSPDNTKLYVTHNRGLRENCGLYQFDLSSNDPNTIINSGVEIPIGNNYFLVYALELAPNGEIFIAVNGPSNYVSKIASPNEKGVACNYIEEALFLEGKRSLLGLPQQIVARKRLGEIMIDSTNILADGTFCIEDAVNFSTSVALDPGVSLRWEFDDPNSGSNNFVMDETEVEHFFYDTTAFEVKLYITHSSICSTTDTLTTTVTVKRCDSTQPFPIPIDLGATPITYIPESFTPNDDGINDVWLISGSDMAEATVQIYDRWGALLYEESGEEPQWDGYYNQTVVDTGIYVCKIDITYTNGTEGSFIRRLTVLK